MQPERREFLKLAALTGAAALTGHGVAVAAEGTASPHIADQQDADHKMEFLHVSGRHIVDTKGNRVRLRGTCPGGWMNMEDFINGHPGAEHTLRSQMTEALGPAKAHFFFERLLDHFFNEDDVIFLRKVGATVVRIPLNYRHFEDDSAPFKYHEAGFTRLNQVLDDCEKHGLYVILDLHSARDGRTSTGILTTPPASVSSGKSLTIRIATSPSGRNLHAAIRTGQSWPDTMC